MEKSRSMLGGFGLGYEFRIETMDTICYLVNQSPSLALDDKTPHNVWTSEKPSSKHLSIFGYDLTYT